jgi:hypothetical protein
MLLLLAAPAPRPTALPAAAAAAERVAPILPLLLPSSCCIWPLLCTCCTGRQEASCCLCAPSCWDKLRPPLTTDRTLRGRLAAAAAARVGDCAAVCCHCCMRLGVALRPLCTSGCVGGSMDPALPARLAACCLLLLCVCRHAATAQGQAARACCCHRCGHACVAVPVSSVNSSKHNSVNHCSTCSAVPMPCFEAAQATTCGTSSPQSISSDNAA